MTTPTFTLDVALRTSAVLVAFSSLVISLEYLALVRGGLFARGSLLDWEVLSTVRHWTCVGGVARILATLYKATPFRALILSQVLLSLLIGLAAIAGALNLVGVACLGLYLIALLLAVRHPFGRDGADEMLSLLLFGLSVATLVPEQRIKVMAVLFVCGQLTLSYIVAGFSKLRSRAWMKEGVLAGILSTDIYGRMPSLGRWLSAHSQIDLLCGLLVVFMEVGYPLLFLPFRAVAIGFLLMTLLFHFATAALMGLYTFLFVFSGAIVLMVWLRMSY
jgi:hypothetical protein